MIEPTLSCLRERVGAASRVRAACSGVSSADPGPLPPGLEFPQWVACGWHFALARGIIAVRYQIPPFPTKEHPR